MENMGFCRVNSAFGGDGVHRLDFWRATEHETEYVCLDCGETLVDYYSGGC